MSLLATRMQNFRAQAPFDRWETRPSRWGALSMFRQETNSPNSMITDDLKQKAIASVNNTLEIPVIDFDAGVTIGSTLPITITGSASTSAMYTVTFVTYSWGFLIHPAKHSNNEISMQREFNAQMQKYIFKFADTLDAAGITALEAAKTQVLSDDLGGRYTLTANVVVAPLAEQDAFIGDVNPLMGGNDYYGPFHVVGNPSLESHVRNRLLEQGTANDRDKTYQYNDKQFHFTNNLANGVGHKATGFFVQQGSVGMIQNFERDAVLGSQTHKHKWAIETLPVLNMPIGTYFYDDAFDVSADGAHVADLTRTAGQAYGFATRVAMVTAYNSAIGTLAAPIMKGAIATT